MSASKNPFAVYIGSSDDVTEEEFGTLTGRVNVLSAAVQQEEAENETKHNVINQKIDANTDSIANMQNSLTTNAAALTNLQNGLTSNTAAVAQMQTSITSVQNGLTSNNAAVAQMQTSITSVQNGLTSNTAAVAQMQTSVTSLQNTVTTLNNSSVSFVRDFRLTQFTVTIPLNRKDIFCLNGHELDVLNGTVAAANARVFTAHVYQGNILDSIGYAADRVPSTYKCSMQSIFQDNEFILPLIPRDSDGLASISLTLNATMGGSFNPLTFGIYTGVPMFGRQVHPVYIFTSDCFGFLRACTWTLTVSGKLLGLVTDASDTSVSSVSYSTTSSSNTSISQGSGVLGTVNIGQPVYPSSAYSGACVTALLTVENDFLCNNVTLTCQMPSDLAPPAGSGQTYPPISIRRLVILGSEFSSYRDT